LRGLGASPTSAPNWLREIENFFNTYKLLEDKLTEVEGWRDENEARRVLLQYRVTP
jgi:inorganic pyrophosphatase